MKSPKVLLMVDAFRAVARKINFDLMTNEEAALIKEHYGESEHLYQIVLDVYKRPSRWLTTGEVSKWDRMVIQEITRAVRKNRKVVIVEMPVGHYAVQPLTWRRSDARRNGLFGRVGEAG